MATLKSAEHMTRAWNRHDFLLLPDQPQRRFVAAVVSSDWAVAETQRLRYEVFNLELREGLAGSHLTGRDEDEFDAQMMHLVLLERETFSIAGTYRLQTAAQAAAGRGFYSAREFDLDGLQDYMGGLVECGRACIAIEHRSISALLQLWHGLIALCRLHRQRWMFGCCSITSRDPLDGWRAERMLDEWNAFAEGLRAPAVGDFFCGERPAEIPAGEIEAMKVPRLFQAYLRAGAKIISEPAIDREFGTVDFLIMADTLHTSLANL